jgi:DNA-binding response OmpR family regulator
MPSTPVEPRRFSYRKPFRALRRVSGQLLRDLLGSPPEASTSDSVKPHILIVDDEESICFSMKDYFSRGGFVVDTARDVDEAERLIELGEYSALIQDLRMGITEGPNGLEVIRFARRRHPSMGIVVLTAHGSPQAENEARLHGADAFLRKPQPLSQVAQVVRGLIEAPRHRVTSQGR